MIDVTAHERVAILRLARPPVNAINLELVQTLGAAIEREAAASESRALVLTGLPGVFSAGIDTREVPGYDSSVRAAMLRAINRAVLALYGCPKPTVAAVSGYALGGGLVLALACDVRLAAQGDFRLGLTEVEAGIPFPAGPLAVVQAELPADRARVLALTGAVLG